MIYVRILLYVFKILNDWNFSSIVFYFLNILFSWKDYTVVAELYGKYFLNVSFRSYCLTVTAPHRLLSVSCTVGDRAVTNT